MLRKTVNYIDYNGEKVTETLYFHLSQVEATKLNAKYDGDISKAIEKIVKEQDGEKMIQFLEDIILGAYGARSEDGRRFVKTPEAREEFEQSIAYAEVFMEILSNPDSAKDFADKVLGGTKVLPKRKDDGEKVLSFDQSPESES